MSEKIVDRVIKLVALASSPNLEEARTAAFQACKLIREHKLVVRERADDKESVWIQDIKAKRDPGSPIVHISSSGRVALCGEHLGTGINYFWMDNIPSLRNCCHACVRKVVGAGR